jgi:hypothetical protein
VLECTLGAFGLHRRVRGTNAVLAHICLFVASCKPSATPQYFRAERSKSGTRDYSSSTLRIHTWGTCTCRERHDGLNEPEGFHIGMVTFKPGFAYPLTCECGRVNDERTVKSYRFRSMWIGKMRPSRYHLTEEEIRKREPGAKFEYGLSHTPVFEPGYLHRQHYGSNRCGNLKTPRADEE